LKHSIFTFNKHKRCSDLKLSTSGLQPPFKLLPGEVHLWLATIDSVPELALLADEQIKLSAIKFPLAARRFESTRKLLRYLLNAYLQCSEYRLEKTNQGKPFLPEFPEFHFNVTHSKKMIMVAFCRMPVGVDLERVRDLDVARIAKRFFSSKELFFLQEKNQEENREIFFKLWTAKEAALKADGRGIAIGMKENVAVMEKKNVVSIQLRKKSWHINAFRFSEKSDCFFGALATPFKPDVIRWNDFRTFDRIRG